jgi:hypothetical protein
MCSDKRLTTRRNTSGDPPAPSLRVEPGAGPAVEFLLVARGWTLHAAADEFAGRMHTLLIGGTGGAEPDREAERFASLPAEGLYVMLARFFSVLYFGFFLLMPYYTTIDKTKPVPDRVIYHG